MKDFSWYKETYPDVIRGYPKIIDYDQWVGFSVTRYIRSEESGKMIYNFPFPAVFVKASPGNGTEYRFFLIDLPEQPELPDGSKLPHGKMLVMDPDPWNAAMYLRGDVPVPGYIGEKLNMNEPDAVAMAIILERVYGE